jgi:hypothetical protein
MEKIFTGKPTSKKMILNPHDVAIVFKADGHIDLSFPEMNEDQIPDHLFAALALSYAVMDEELFDLIQERFAESLEQEATPVISKTTKKPALKVVT